jgi:hypothetical protein
MAVRTQLGREEDGSSSAEVKDGLQQTSWFDHVLQYLHSRDGRRRSL